MCNLFVFCVTQQLVYLYLFGRLLISNMILSTLSVDIKLEDLIADEAMLNNPAPKCKV